MRGGSGQVVGGAATFANPGMEMWHPNPFFFFQKGGGPVLDIGCYPITQLVNCLGPVESVVAHASRGREMRTVTSELHRGKEIKVEVPTTVNGVLAFASGANVSFTASWDIWKHARHPIELYGTEGSILNPDPNFFGGTVMSSVRDGEWQEVSIEGRPFGAPTRHLSDGRTHADYRMAGVFDMACAIASGPSASRQWRIGPACAGDHGGPGVERRRRPPLQRSTAAARGPSRFPTAREKRCSSHRPAAIPDELRQHLLVA